MKNQPTQNTPDENAIPLEACFHPAGWTAEDRGLFNRESKAYLFKSIMTHFSAVEVPGDYFEFGCYGAFTMRMAWDYTKVLRRDMNYVAFDSFEGFPEGQVLDEGYWKKGDLAMSEEDFRALCKGHGLPEEKLNSFKGFFEQSLRAEETVTRLGNRKAAVVYIDVDTYSPTAEILRFLPPYLQRGTVIVFDDWNCFYADDSLGERRAWKEFTEAHSELKFTPYVGTHLAQSFICLDAG